MVKRKRHAIPRATRKGGGMKADLTYHKRGGFVLFLPETKAGEDAWRQIAEHTEGTGKVLCVDLEETLQSIRKAGYSVKRGKPLTSEDDAEIDALLSSMD